MVIGFVLLFCHILGDFYLQCQHCVERKQNFMTLKGMMCLIIHSLVYTACFLVFVFIFKVRNGLPLYFILLFCSHLLIDLISSLLKKKNKYILQIFCLDQLAHALVILGIFFYIKKQNGLINPMWLVTNFKIYSAIICLLFLFLPCSVFMELLVKEIFKTEIYKKDKKANKDAITNKGEKINIGAVLGSLERCISFLLIIISSYVAFGLIIAAKTWARDKNNKDVSPELYIVGTFLSLFMALSVSVLYLKVFTVFY